MKTFETKRLFYNQFLNKLVIVNPIAFIFRNFHGGYARRVIDNLQSQYDSYEKELMVRNGSRLFSVSHETFLELKRLYNHLSSAPVEFKLRVESTYLCIYSNEISFLRKIKHAANNPKELWQPKVGIENRYQPYTIIVNAPPEYEYKVTLPGCRQVDLGLADWAIANPDKIKASSTVLERLKRGSYVQGYYFYVRDEKILNLVELMLKRVGRIDKLVYVDDQDK